MHNGGDFSGPDYGPLEPLPPMNSRELSVISAILLPLAAGACLALAVIVARRPEAAALRPTLAACDAPYPTLELGHRFDGRSSITSVSARLRRRFSGRWQRSEG